MSEADINYTKEAFLHPWNLTFLIAGMLIAFTISLVTASPTWLFQTVLLFAAAGELLYLGMMPRQERFRRLIKSQRAEEHAKPPSLQEIFRLLTKVSQRRYAKLRTLEKKIKTNYQKERYASQGLLESHLKKINGLLDSYLKLLYRKEHYSVSLQSTTESNVLRSIGELREDMTDDPPRVLAYKERRLRILEQRLEEFKKGQEDLQIIEAQLATIEDVVKYIHEQSLTLRNPEEITFQLDTLLSEVEATQAAVKEIEEVFATPTDLMADMDLFEDPAQEQAAKDQTGLRN